MNCCDSNPSDRLRPAAEYVRMSTEKQVYSIENQRDANLRYAIAHDLEIVETFTDEGRSGLTYDRRPGLQTLLRHIQSGQAIFQVLIVYDVSRWGRFQDTDESAHYEYLCRRAGVSVVYCAEPFLNEATGFAAVMKGVKRAMAAEYSRELSHKVFTGQSRLIRMGFRQGGRPGFGFRRRLVGPFGADKGLLGLGEQKSIQSDRVVLTLGPPDEVAIVRQIFRRFARDGWSEQAIANWLNAHEIKTDRGRSWRRDTVHCILTNEKYMGNTVFGRSRGRLGSPRRPVDPAEWVRATETHPAIIEPSLFRAVQRRIHNRQVRQDPRPMLQALLKVQAKHGRLSERLINATPSTPKAHLYKSRFGSLLAAYELVGYRPPRDYRFRQEKREIRRLARVLTDDLLGRLRTQEREVKEADGDWEINGLRLALRLVRPQLIHGTYRWLFQPDDRLPTDLLALVRLQPDVIKPLDVFLLPRVFQSSAPIRLAERGNGVFDHFRYNDLTFVQEIVAWSPIPALQNGMPVHIAAAP